MTTAQPPPEPLHPWQYLQLAASCLGLQLKKEKVQKNTLLFFSINEICTAVLYIYTVPKHADLIVHVY